MTSRVVLACAECELAAQRRSQAHCSACLIRNDVTPSTLGTQETAYQFLTRHASISVTAISLPGTRTSNFLGMPHSQREASYLSPKSGKSLLRMSSFSSIAETDISSCFAATIATSRACRSSQYVSTLNFCLALHSTGLHQCGTAGSDPET